MDCIKPQYDPAKLLVERAWKAEIAVWQQRGELASLLASKVAELLFKFINDVPTSQRKIEAMALQASDLLHQLTHIADPSHTCKHSDPSLEEAITLTNKLLSIVRTNILSGKDH